MFIAGLAGVAFETLVTDGTRPALLALFAARMGLPFVLRQDRKNGSA